MDRDIDLTMVDGILDGKIPLQVGDERATLGALRLTDADTKYF